MAILPSMPVKYTVSLFLAFIAAGLAGNYWSFPIFFNIDFLFGSVFAMLALQFFGFGRGVLAAFLIAGYTYFLWNHAYAIITMTAEVAIVGLLMKRSRVGMVMADTLFWIVIGMPLVFLCYHFAMQIPAGETPVFMIKQALNGITNALVARMVFTGYMFQSRTSQLPYREIIYNLLAFFVLCPALILLAAGSRADFNQMDRRIRSTIVQDSVRLSDRIEAWTENRKHAVISLSELAVVMTPEQIQPFLEHSRKSDVNFLRVGLVDSAATSVAFSPLVDENGKSTVGLSFAERPYIPLLKQTLKPMFSEVVPAKVGVVRPIVLILSPVVRAGNFGGYAFGVLDLSQIQDHLDKSTGILAGFYTLLDKNGRIIMTNRRDQTVMTSLDRGKGAFRRLDERVSQWMPEVPVNVPFFDSWKKSLYVEETTVGGLAGWKLVLEQPMAPFVKTLSDSFFDKLSLLFLVLLVSLAIAEFMSRLAVSPLSRLSRLTHELPGRLAEEDKGNEWPVSCIKEESHLIHNFREMSAALSEQLSRVRQANETLERRVDERTSELRESERYTTSIIDSITPSIAVLDPDGTIVNVNEPWRRFARENGNPLSYPDYLGSNYLSICQAGLDSDEDEYARAAITGIHSVINGEHEQFTMEYPCHSPQEQRWFLMTVTLVRGPRNGVVISHANITKRKLAEASLRDNINYVNTVMLLANDGIIVQERSGRITVWNHTAERVFGLSADEACGLTSVSHEWKTFNEDGSPLPGSDHPSMKTLASGEPCLNTIMKVERGDGGYSWINVNTSPILSEHETQPGSVVITFSDITERKQLERSMQARLKISGYASARHSLEELLTKVLDEAEAVTDSRIGFFHFVDEDQVTLYLQTWSSNTLSSMCSAEGKGLHYPLDSAGVWADCIREQRPLIHNDYGNMPGRKGLPAGHAPVQRELVVPVFRNNRIVAVIGVGNKKSDYTEQDVNAIQQLSNLAWDLITRKRAEEALQESEIRFRSIMEMVPNIAVQGYGLDGTTTYWNNASEVFYGYSRQEVLGRNLLDLIIPPEIKEEVRKSIVWMGESGEVIPPGELELIRKDGTRVQVFSCHAILKPTGKPVELFCMDLDLTQLKQAEAELIKAKEVAESASRAKSEFLATMSHEIRTPMNGVIGMLELLQHSSLTTEQYQYAEKAKKSGVELVGLLNNILDVSRIEAGRLELERTEFDLGALVGDTIGFMTLLAREKGVALSYSLDADVPLNLAGDPGRLRQIIINLVGNAIKFTDRGFVSLKVRKDHEDEGTATVRFLIQDSGIGIARDKLDLIFENFTQADSSTTRTYGGSGLGLAICSKLSALMGGSIGVESTKGQGALFWFTAVLGRQRGDVGGAQAGPDETSQPDMFHPDSHVVNHACILLTEDDPRAQEIVPKLLAKYGYQVDVACDGREALQALEKKDYALVLMDCMMPEMNGYEVTAIIRNPDSAVRRHDIPVIALTGNAMKQDRDRCIAAGMDDHLSKPLALKDLLAKLAAWIRE